MSSLPRLKTAVWVDAFLRRCMTQGKFGAVLHKGHEEAGALMVVVNHLDGTHTLLAPAPGPAYDEEGTRRFEKRSNTPLDWPSTSALIQRARRSDDDLWVIEVEDRQGLAGLVADGG
jgi:hypothetical protein